MLRRLAGWAPSYVGIPYRALGRERETGLDCWGLVRLVYADRFSITLPSYLDEYDDSADRDATSGAIVRRRADEWREAPHAQVGDVVLLRLLGRECHVGVYVGNGYTLHARAGVNSCIEHMQNRKWAPRISGYWRHRHRA